jgi:hypothetical protein
MILLQIIGFFMLMAVLGFGAAVMVSTFKAALKWLDKD